MFENVGKEYIKETKIIHTVSWFLECGFLGVFVDTF